MDDVQWPKALNYVITKRWSQLKNSLVMKDFVDHLIQRRVVTLDYWMGLKSKPVSESERTEDFLSIVLKFDQNKFNHFLEALIIIDRKDLARQLMKCQDVKQHSGKSRNPEKPPNTSKPRLGSSKASGVAGTDLNAGQGDSDQLPSAYEPAQKPNKQLNNPDGHNGSLESNKPFKKKTDTVPSSEVQGVKHKPQQGNGKTSKPEFPVKANIKTVTMATESRSNDDAKKIDQKTLETSQDRKPTKTKDIPLATGKYADQKGDIKNTNPGNPRELTEVKDAPTMLEGTKAVQDERKQEEELKQREELKWREEQLKHRETELNQKELKLQEQENKLKQKETELLTRENSLLTSSDLHPLAATMPFQVYRENSNPPTATSTQSTDVFAEVRDQLAELKKEQEIDSELTTRLGFHRDDFVKSEELQAVQQEVKGLRDEIATDRSQRENLHQKVEDLKQEIEALHSTIKTLKLEKQTDKTQLEKEVNRLTTDLKNAKLSYNDAITKIRQDMKQRENEHEKLKVQFEDAKKEKESLDKRVLALENEKQRFEVALVQYERDVSELKKQIEEKETQLLDLRKALEDTEDEKEDLVEEVGGLKTEVARLKSERKRLESEKKTLLGRCVKPGWSTSRKPTFNK